HSIFREDIRLLEALALGVGKLFFELAHGQSPPRPVDAVGIFEERLQHPLLDVVLRRADRLRKRCAIGALRVDPEIDEDALVRTAYGELKDLALAFVAKEPKTLLAVAGNHEENPAPDPFELLTGWVERQGLAKTTLIEVPQETAAEYAGGKAAE